MQKQLEGGYKTAFQLLDNKEIQITTGHTWKGWS